MDKRNIKESIKETWNLLYSFKWYIIAYLFAAMSSIREYFWPPAKNDPIWGAEATEGAWNYQNQELYLESIKINMIFDVLFFLLGTSNMRNHPRIAKFIFLYPWLGGLVNLIWELLK